MSKDETLDHPSYGLVQFSHVTGHRRLFGSSLDTHERTVCLSIKHASLIRNDSGDRYSGLIDGDMVEVHMSAAQFAELLTTMNIGSGVPCTITRVNRQTVAPPPEVDHQTKSVQNKFADRMQDLASKILADSAEVQTLLEKKSLNVADRNRLQGVFKKLSMELNSNAPFFLEMFEEASEKIMTSAKAEIEAFAVASVHELGLRALGANQVQATEPLQLPKKS